MKIMVEEGDGVILRKIQTTPREHWEGQWKKGRLYTLYSVVQNNGSVFVANTGKAKNEPFAIYESANDKFVANEGWDLRFLSADSRISAMGGGSVSGDFVLSGDVVEIVPDV